MPTKPNSLSGEKCPEKRRVISLLMQPDRWIQKEALARGLGVILAHYFGLGLPYHVTSVGVLTNQLYDSEMLKPVLDSGCPCIRLGREKNPKDSVLPAVLPDNLAPARLAAEHFADCNFGTVGCFKNTPGDVWFNGFVDEFCGRAEELGMTCHIGTFNRIYGEQGADRIRRRQTEFNAWLRCLPTPIGLLTEKGSHALCHTSTISQLGLSTPQDIGILSSEEDSNLDFSVPTVSYIDYNWEERIRITFNVLDEINAGKAPPNAPIYVPPKGIVRNESTHIWQTSDSNVSEALRIMWDNLDVTMSTQDIADEVGLSGRQLNRLFSKELGRSVRQELRRKRLAEVEILLRTTNTPIMKIANLTGYSTDDYLCKAFRAKFGMSPGEYRAKNIQ